MWGQAVSPAVWRVGVLATQSFGEAQAATIQKPRDQCWYGRQTGQHATRLGLSQNYWHMSRAYGTHHLVQPWQVNGQHLPIEKEQRLQGLILCRRRDVLIHRKRRQETLNLISATDARVFRLAIANVTSHPSGITLLSCQAQVTQANLPSGCLKQCCWMDWHCHAPANVTTTKAGDCAPEVRRLSESTPAAAGPQ